MKPLRPDEVLAFDPPEFADVVLLGIAAGESQDGQPLVADRPRADGTVEVLEVPDNPYGKATFALRRRYLDDDVLFASALARFRAFMSLVARGGLDRWIRRGEAGRMAIHPAAIDVAARFRISKNGRFAPRKFLAAVEEVAAALYPDLDWP